MANALVTIISPQELPMCLSSEHILDYALNELPTTRRKISTGCCRTIWILVINILREIDYLSHPKSDADFDQEPYAADALLISVDFLDDHLIT
ncbi:hypothetical protein VTP01DRAFT_7071 [Rhizomucor pusillus]|uniref:uncharacterized protein n=1 Tax=Rhizomucor pusillus TaxID=4840 RepID=UPI0037446F82